LLVLSKLAIFVLQVPLFFTIFILIIVVKNSFFEEKKNLLNTIEVYLI